MLGHIFEKTRDTKQTELCQIQGEIRNSYAWRNLRKRLAKFPKKETNEEHSYAKLWK